MGRTSVLLVIGLAAILGIVANYMNKRGMDSVDSNVRNYNLTQAKNIARSGALIVMRRVQADTVAASAQVGVTQTINLKGNSKGSTNSTSGDMASKNGSGIAYGQAKVKITQKTPGSMENLILTSEGTYGVATATVSVNLSRSLSNPPLIDGALGVAIGKKAQIKVDKDAIIDGFNHKLDGSLDDKAYPAINGISVGMIGQLTDVEVLKDSKGKPLAKVKGKGSIDGDPEDIAIGQAQPDYSGWVSSLIKKADVTYTNKELTKLSVLGTKDNPQITYVTGSTTIKEDVSGYGVLIIDGKKFKVSNKADFNFTGLVLVMADSLANDFDESVNLGKSTKIVGGLCVAGKKTKISLKKGAQILYSAPAIDMAMGVVRPKNTDYSAIWWE